MGRLERNARTHRHTQYPRLPYSHETKKRRKTKTPQSLTSIPNTREKNATKQSNTGN
jgi:hypothetical protein